jgi:hypothetical protein
LTLAKEPTINDKKKKRKKERKAIEENTRIKPEEKKKTEKRSVRNCEVSRIGKAELRGIGRKGGTRRLHITCCPLAGYR